VKGFDKKKGEKKEDVMRILRVLGLVLLMVGVLWAQGDNCSSAWVISSLPFWTYSNTAGYTNDYSLPDTGCTGNTTFGPDGVYSFTPQNDICISLEVIIPQSGWDASIYVLSDCDNLVCVAGVDQYGEGSPEALYVTMTPGVTYYFVVDGKDTSDYGPFVLGLSECTTDIEEGILKPSLELISFKVNPSITRNSTKFFYSLPIIDEVKIDIYDASGRLVKSIASRGKEANIVWNCDDMNGSRLDAGVYFVKFEAMGKKITEKIVLLR